MLSSFTILPSTRQPNLSPHRLIWDYRYPLNATFNYYNPSILALPKGSKFPYLVVFRRGYHEWDMLLAMCVAREFYNEQLLNYYIGCIEPPKEIRVESTGYDHVQNHEQKWGMGHDGRLFWSADGAPMMIFTQKANEHKNNNALYRPFIVDARSAFPEIAEFLPTSCGENHIPIEYKRGTELDRPARQQCQDKNWMTFVQDSTLFVTTNLMPHEIYAIQMKNQLKRVIKDTSYTCFGKRNFPNHRKIHLATNGLTLVLCRQQDNCAANDTTKAVNIAIIHYRMEPRFPLHPILTWRMPVYTRHVMMWNISYPYNIICIFTIRICRSRRCEHARNIILHSNDVHTAHR